MKKLIQAYANKPLIWIVYIIICFALSRCIMYFFCFDGDGIGLFIQAQVQYDAEWYKQIAENIVVVVRDGPSQGQASWVFFPLYPMLVRVLCIITKIDTVYMGTLLSVLFLWVAEYYSFLYVKKSGRSIKTAYIYTFIMTYGPYTFYFSTLYTESLYLMLLTMCMYYMMKHEYLKMGIVGAFLSITRNTGVMFVFVIAGFVLTEYLKDKKNKSIIGFLQEIINNSSLILGTTMVPLGLFAYMFLLRLKLGDGFAFVHGQVGWWRENIGIFTNFKNDFIGTFPSGFLSSVFLIILCLIIYIIYNKRYYEAIMPIIVILLSATSSLGSVPRYMMGSLFCVLALADYISTKSKTYIIVSMIILILVGLNFETAWLQGNGLLL